jgi:hypothetical protein
MVEWGRIIWNKHNKEISFIITVIDTGKGTEKNTLKQGCNVMETQSLEHFLDKDLPEKREILQYKNIVQPYQPEELQLMAKSWKYLLTL